MNKKRVSYSNKFNNLKNKFNPKINKYKYTRLKYQIWEIQMLRLNLWRNKFLKMIRNIKNLKNK